MIIGVPREIKDGENRVAITPAGVSSLTGRGHRVLVESGAGVASGFSDKQYKTVKAEIVPSAVGVFERADLILKVKEPLPPEIALLREAQILFTYLHLASSRQLTEALLERKIVGIGYETVQLDDGRLPLLIPMSEVAGRLAVQVGAHYLQTHAGGRGILLSGVPGVPPAEVAVIGCGVVGMNAVKAAAGLGASVTALDSRHEPLRRIDNTIHGRVITVHSNPYTIAQTLDYADVVISSPLVPGTRAPQVVTEEMVQRMRQGAMIVDVAIDQGGSVETMRPTTHSDPVFVKHGVLHYGVTNMPAAVPRTSTWALTNATLRYVCAIADLGWREAARRDPALARGVQLVRGQVTHSAVAESLGMPYVPLEELA